MCDCIKRIESEIVEKAGTYEGKKITRASLQDAVFPLENLRVVGKITTTRVELDLEGRKTPAKTSISHTYCPFCGVKYIKEADENLNSNSKAV